LAAALVALMSAISGSAVAQPVSGGLCRPVQERKAEIGCWILGHIPVGQFAAPATWYLHTFSDRASAEAGRGPRGIVVEAFNKVWLFTAEEAGWKGPSGGELHLAVGPLPVTAAADYSAQFMEAVFTPGMASAAHVHSGPEAFHTLEGETCLETPAGVRRRRAGDHSRRPDAPDGDRSDTAPRFRADPAPHRPARDDAHPRLDAEGAVHGALSGAGGMRLAVRPAHAADRSIGRSSSMSCTAPTERKHACRRAPCRSCARDARMSLRASARRISRR
jgi:hypothetical protein